MSAVVSDTSPLHYLIECDAIEILPALFRQVFIPPTVYRELQQPRTPPRVRAWAASLPPWIRVQAPTVLDGSLKVDAGEREAICLAREGQPQPYRILESAGKFTIDWDGSFSLEGDCLVIDDGAEATCIEHPHLLAEIRAAVNRVRKA